jgi:DNA replication protein DnaC
MKSVTELNVSVPCCARLDHSILYLRMPRLFENLSLARLDGRFPRLVDKLARVQLLILDDWGSLKKGQPSKPIHQGYIPQNKSFRFVGWPPSARRTQDNS